MCEFEPRGEWKSNDTQLSQLVSCRNPTKTAEKSDSQWYIYLRLVAFMVNDGKRMQKYHTWVLWVGWNLLDGSVKCTHKYSVVKCRFYLQNEVVR